MEDLEKHACEDLMHEINTQHEIEMQLEQQKQSEAFNSKIEEWKKDLNVKVYEDRI